MLKTFGELAEAAGHRAAFPLTCPLVVDVAAALRKGGYRSAEQYLQRALQENVDRGHVNSPQLHRQVRKALRSCARGLGPAARAAALDLRVVSRAQEHETPPGAPHGAPAHPRRTGSIACWFLLREIELSAVRVRALRLSHVTREATLTLPESKQDPSAESKSRTHGCCCGEQPDGAAICPFHLLVAQRAYAVSKHGGESQAAGRPLFPAGKM